MLILCTTLFKINFAQSTIIPIKSDGKGYYDYLPSLFIRSTFGNELADHRYIIETKYGNLSLYSAGTAIAIAPFFIIATAYYELTAQVYTGYEVGFGNAVLCASFFYFLLGLIFYAQNPGVSYQVEHCN